MNWCRSSKQEDTLVVMDSASLDWILRSRSTIKEHRWSIIDNNNVHPLLIIQNLYSSLGAVICHQSQTLTLVATDLTRSCSNYLHSPWWYASSPTSFWSHIIISILSIQISKCHDYTNLRVSNSLPFSYFFFSIKLSNILSLPGNRMCSDTSSFATVWVWFMAVTWEQAFFDCCEHFLDDVQ